MVDDVHFGVFGGVSVWLFDSLTLRESVCLEVAVSLVSYGEVT